MASLLDGLEKQRLIRRHHDTADRRGVCVRLTRQGRALIQGLVQQHVQWIAALFDNFAPTELRQLQRLLQKLARNTGAGDVLPYIDDGQGKGERMS